MSSHIIIYSSQVSERSTYVFKLILTDLLGLSFEFTQDESAAQINYSNKSNATGLQCIPHGLLEENEIRKSIVNEIQFERWKNKSCFFRTASQHSELPFDLFAATFFLVSRYEEYLNFEPDTHHRFPATASILFKNKVLHEPLVNQWALILRDSLINNYPTLKFNERKFEYRSTIDIDQAWKFKNKGILRNCMGSIQDFFQGKWENFKDRWPVLLGLKLDPFYNFNWQEMVHKQFNVTVNYFILLGDRSLYDKNIKHTNSQFQNLIKGLYALENCTVGIHPSYSSNFNDNLVNLEIKRLKTIVGKSIATSRQHFLMHQMPKTYEVLIENGITEEHTMGYSTHLGFRAGIASPFNFFNLKTNVETSLKLIPFCAMDITPLHYNNESPKEAIKTLEELMNAVKNVNGLFVSLWHNESFSETERWKGWRKVYLSLLKNSR